jgi:hypothetical protein
VTAVLPKRRELTIFDVLFETLPDGSLTPRFWIQIEGRQLGPGASLGPDYKPYGVPLEEWRGHLIFGHQEGKFLVIDAVER